MPADTTDRILNFFDDDPKLDALFGSYQKDTVPQNFSSVYKNLLHHYTHQISSTDAITFCSWFGAIRRDVFLSLGGYNESQQALEDIEFGYRLHQAGHRVRLVQDLLLPIIDLARPTGRFLHQTRQRHHGIRGACERFASTLVKPVTLGHVFKPAAVDQARRSIGRRLPA